MFHDDNNIRTILPRLLLWQVNQQKKVQGQGFRFLFFFCHRPNSEFHIFHCHNSFSHNHHRWNKHNLHNCSHNKYGPLCHSIASHKTNMLRHIGTLSPTRRCKQLQKTHIWQPRAYSFRTDEILRCFCARKCFLLIQQRYSRIIDRLFSTKTGWGNINGKLDVKLRWRIIRILYRLPWKYACGGQWLIKAEAPK